MIMSNKLEKITVLITAAGNVFMPGTIACLKNNGEREIRVIGADLNKDDTILQMCNAAYQVPRGDSPDYIDALLDVCRKEQVDILLPIMSVELNKLAENRARFEALGTKVSVSDTKALEIANDKRKLLDFLKDQGIPCAEYEVIHHVEEIKAAVMKLGYPKKRVCIKATNGSGSRGFRIIDDTVSRFDLFLNDKPTSGVIRLEELISVLQEKETIPELIAMEYLPGAEYTVDLLADHGESRVICCRKSLRMENSIMLEAEIVDNPQITDLCYRTTKALGLDGNIGYDIREREDGTPFIMECNPRITAGVPYFHLAGTNLPYLCVKKLLGEELSVSHPEYGKIVRRRWMEMTV